MYFGCASVLQSIVTSVPEGAPTNWLGTNIIGETVHSSSVWIQFDGVCVCVHVIRMDWVAYRMCVYMRVIAFRAIRCNAENTWEPKRRRYYNFSFEFVLVWFFSFVHSFIVYGFFVDIRQRNDDTDIKSIHWALQRDEINGTSSPKRAKNKWRRQRRMKENDISKVAEE